MEEPFIPLLSTTDWNAEWKLLQAQRQRSEDPAEWDARAKSFPVKHGSQSGYVKRFLELAAIEQGETVLDMGCGTGALATPLAMSGCRVIACDFSRGMMDVMLADQEELGVDGVESHLLSWADDWSSVGLRENSVDVALASRSIATNDLEASLMKLDRVARRRVCLTLSCGPSPRCDERLLEAAGFRPRLGRDFLYAFNILACRGINPEVAYIPSARMELFDSFEEACEGFSKIAAEAVRGFATQAELSDIPRRMRLWLDAHIVQDEKGFHLREDRKVTWAFIAWTPSGE